MNAFLIPQASMLNAPNTNLFPMEMMFNNAYTWTVSAGTGSGVNQTSRAIEGARSLRVTSSVTAGLTINSATDIPLTTIPETGLYILSFAKNEANLGVDTNSVAVDVQVFINRDLTNVTFFTETDVLQKDIYKIYFATFQLEAGDTIGIGFKVGISDVGTQYRHYFDCFKLEADSYGQGIPTVFSPPLEFIDASDSLDFPSTLTGATADLTIAADGAKDGDVVALGAPASAWAFGTYFAFVSDDDEVTIRYTNTQGTTQDPTVATFNVKVFK